MHFIRNMGLQIVVIFEKNLQLSCEIAAFAWFERMSSIMKDDFRLGLVPFLVSSISSTVAIVFSNRSISRLLMISLMKFWY